MQFEEQMHAQLQNVYYLMVRDHVAYVGSESLS